MLSGFLFTAILLGGKVLYSCQQAEVSLAVRQRIVNVQVAPAEVDLAAVPVNMGIPYAAIVDPENLPPGNYVFTRNIALEAKGRFPKEFTCDYSANVQVIADASRDLLPSLENSNILSIHAELTRRLASRMPDAVSSAALDQSVLVFLKQSDSDCPADFYVDYNPRRHPNSLFRAKCRFPKGDNCNCKTFGSIETVYYFLGFTPNNVPVWQMVPTVVEINCNCNDSN